MLYFQGELNDRKGGRNEGRCGKMDCSSLFAYTQDFRFVGKEAMKIIIAGSRAATYYPTLLSAIQKSAFEITEVVCGDTLGVDRMGEVWAQERGIPITYFKPDWNRYGKNAGPKRNRKMAKYADALIAVWDGESRDTGNMIEEMKRLGKPFWVEQG